MYKKQDELLQCKVAFAEERLALMRVTDDAKRLAELVVLAEFNLQKEDLEIVAKYVDTSD